MSHDKLISNVNSQEEIDHFYDYANDRVVLGLKSQKDDDELI